MNMLLQFLPLLLFFFTYHQYDMYAAILVLMIASTISNAILWVLQKHLSKVDIATYCMIMLFGAASLWFHNPLFIKWKPTILFWLFAFIIWFNHFIRKSNTVKWLLEKNISLPANCWSTLDHFSAIYFSIMGTLNLWVLLNMSEKAWVNFKSFGIIISSIIFSLSIGVYIVKNANMIKQT